jgi:hypothetical protein
MGSANLMRWAGYALAIVVGVVGLISGIASGAGVLAGAAVGWLVDSVILIIRGQTAKVEGTGEPDVAIFAIFYGLPAWLWGVCVGIIVVGGVAGFLIKH